MIERLRRFRMPHLALAGAVVFAAIPLSPAMGLIGFPPDAQTPAAAEQGATVPSDTGSSAVTMMEAVSRHQQMLAAQSAEQRREAAAARRRAAALATRQQADFGSATTTSVSTSTAIPTTDVTAKTRQIQALVREHFPADQLGNAMAVAACESGHADAKGAVNSDGTIDWGVFQLNDGGTLQGGLSAIGVSYSSKEDAQNKALDTATNVKAAASIYADRGWAPWVCAYKIGIVASLYGNAPGPMDGKFDEWGKPTVDVPVVTVDPGTTDSDDEPQGGDRDKPGKDRDKPGKDRDKPGKDRDKGGSGGDPTPEPTPSPTRTPRPDPSPTPAATPRPTSSPQPTPSSTQ